MTAGLMHLQTYGSQDIFLTSNPQITYFKIVYRKHTNFGLQSIAQNFTSNLNFGTESMCILDKYGDLATRMYLEIEIPSITIPKPTNKSNIQLLQTLANLLRNILNDINQLINLNAQIITQNTTPTIIEIDNQINQISINRNKIIDIAYNFPQLTEIYELPFTFYNYNLAKKKIIDPIFLSSYYQSMKMLYMPYYDLYVKIDCMLKNTNCNRYKCAWVEELGHAIIDLIEFKIGNQRIDIHTGQWLILHNRLVTTSKQIPAYYQMIGNVNQLINSDIVDKPKRKIIIPLQFHFCKYQGLALPLLALTKSDIIFNVKLNELSDVFYLKEIIPNQTSMESIQSTYNINILGAKIYVDYIFLDETERKRFAESIHEYLVEIVQNQYVPDITSPSYTAKLKFYGPTKYIVWILQSSSYRNNPNMTTRCQWNNFASKDDMTGQPMERVWLTANNICITNKNTLAQYYNYVVPFLYFPGNPTDGIYTNTFCLNPIDYQPSGSINLDAINSFTIDMKFTNDFYSNTMQTNSSIYFSSYAVSYNILRIANGIAALAFGIKR